MTAPNPARFSRIRTEDGTVHLVHEAAAFDWSDDKRPAVIVRCGARVNVRAFDPPAETDPLCATCWEPK